MQSILDILPNEILNKILCQSNIPDILTFGRTCKNAYQFIQDKLIYLKILKDSYPLSIQPAVKLNLGGCYLCPIQKAYNNVIYNEELYPTLIHDLIYIVRYAYIKQMSPSPYETLYYDYFDAIYSKTKITKMFANIDSITFGIYQQ
jgi:hypothetical protein